MEEIQIKTFTSRIGNSMTAPADWITEDQGAVWSLRVPNNQAALTIFTYTAEGSGSLDDLKALMVTHKLTPSDAGWQKTRCYRLTASQGEMTVDELAPTTGDAAQKYRLYLLHAGLMYHAIILHTSESILELNGDFYDSVVQTFVGRE